MADLGDRLFGNFDHSSQIKDFLPRGTVSRVESRITDLFEGDDDDVTPTKKPTPAPTDDDPFALQPEPTRPTQKNPVTEKPPAPEVKPVAAVPPKPVHTPSVNYHPNHRPLKTANNLFDDEDDDFVLHPNSSQQSSILSTPTKTKTNLNDLSYLNKTLDPFAQPEHFKNATAQNPTPAQQQPVVAAPPIAQKKPSGGLFDEDEAWAPKVKSVDIFSLKPKDSPTPKHTKVYHEEDEAFYAKTNMDNFFSGKKVIEVKNNSVQEPAQEVPVVEAPKVEVQPTPEPEPEPVPVAPVSSIPVPIVPSNPHLDPFDVSHPSKPHSTSGGLFDGSDEEEDHVFAAPKGKSLADGFFESKPKVKELFVKSNASTPPVAHVEHDAPFSPEPVQAKVEEVDPFATPVKLSQPPHAGSVGVPCDLEAPIFGQEAQILDSIADVKSIEEVSSLPQEPPLNEAPLPQEPQLNEVPQELQLNEAPLPQEPQLNEVPLPQETASVEVIAPSTMEEPTPIESESITDPELHVESLPVAPTPIISEQNEQVTTPTPEIIPEAPATTTEVILVQSDSVSSSTTTPFDESDSDDQYLCQPVAKNGANFDNFFSGASKDNKEEFFTPKPTPKATDFNQAFFSSAPKEKDNFFSPKPVQPTPKPAIVNDEDDDPFASKPEKLEDPFASKPEPISSTNTTPISQDEDPFSSKPEQVSSTSNSSNVTISTKPEEEESEDDDPFSSKPASNLNAFHSKPSNSPTAAPAKFDAFFSASTTKDKSPAGFDQFFSGPPKESDPFGFTPKSKKPIILESDDDSEEQPTSKPPTPAPTPAPRSLPNTPTPAHVTNPKADDPFDFTPAPITKPNDTIPTKPNDFIPTPTPKAPPKDDDLDFSFDSSTSASPMISPVPQHVSTPTPQDSSKPVISQDYVVFDTVPTTSSFQWTNLLSSFLPKMSFIQLSEDEVKGLVSFTYSRHDGQTVNHHVSDREKAIMREYERRIDIQMQKMGCTKVVVSVNFASPRDSVRLKNDRSEKCVQAMLQKFASQHGVNALNDNHKLILLSDAFNNALHVSNGREAVEFIRKSSFIKSELKAALVAAVPEVYFVVREAEEFAAEREFYGFVNNQSITSMVQYHEFCMFSQLKQGKQTTQEHLQRYLTSIKEKAPDQTFYVHVAILPNETCRILEYVPLPAGSPQLLNFPPLFGQKVDKLLTQGPVQFVIRQEALLPTEPRPAIMSKAWMDLFTRLSATLPKNNPNQPTAKNDENCSIQ